MNVCDKQQAATQYALLSALFNLSGSLAGALSGVGAARLGYGAYFALTFVLALNNFAVPALLQVKVFPVEVWLEFNTNLKVGAALVMSWPLVLAPLLLLFWLRHRVIAWPRLDGAVSAIAFRRRLGASWFAAGGVATLIILGLAVGVPLLKLCGNGRTWRELMPAFLAGQTAIFNSAGFAAVAGILVVAIALATWRWPVGLLTWFPFLVPGVLLDLVLIYALGRVRIA